MRKVLKMADQSIKSKIVIIVTVIFAFFIIMSLLFSLYSLEKRSENEMTEYRESEETRTREALKSYVHIAYTAVETNYKNATDVNYLSDYYGERLRNLVDIAEAILKDKAEEVKRGRISKAQAQKQAIEMIRNMQYNNGVGYYFMFTNETPFPKMIVEPHSSSLNGKVLDDKKFNNASGSNKNLFRAAVEAVANENEGFIDYIWPKPYVVGSEGGGDIAKFSYLRVFKEWNWIIGTGIYLDDAIKDCIKKSKSDLRYMRYDNGTGYYWINDATKPTPRLIMNPFIPKLEGQILTDKKYNRAYDEDYNLYEAFLEACEETGDGFVPYKWDKPIKGGIIEDAQKSSYVKFFKPLGWVIGSGVYIDDIDKAINAKIKVMEKEKQDLIVSYLLISLTLAGISISVLVFMMNRYFRAHAGTQEDESEHVINEDDTASTQETEANDNAVKSANKETNQDENPLVATTDATTTSDVTKIIEVVLKEQTRQLALNKFSDQELQQKSAEQINILKDEIRNLISEVKASNK